MQRTVDLFLSCRVSDMSNTNPWAYPGILKPYRGLVNDTYRMDLILIHPPHFIALACIYVASVLKDKENTAWFEELHVDMNVVKFLNLNPVLVMLSLFLSLDIHLNRNILLVSPLTWSSLAILKAPFCQLFIKEANFFQWAVCGIEMNFCPMLISKDNFSDVFLFFYLPCPSWVDCISLSGALKALSIANLVVFSLINF